MKSTGEVMGTADTFDEVHRKAQWGRRPVGSTGVRHVPPFDRRGS